MATVDFTNHVVPRRVLVVEDQLLAALSIRTILTADRHIVEIAENGERALAMFKAAPHDLVITDFKLASMDGLRLAQAIKEHSPATPVFLITAYIEKLGGKLPNIDLVLGKPFAVAELQRAVRDAFSNA